MITWSVLSNRMYLTNIHPNNICFTSTCCELIKLKYMRSLMNLRKKTKKVKIDYLYMYKIYILKKSIFLSIVLKFRGERRWNFYILQSEQYRRWKGESCQTRGLLRVYTNSKIITFSDQSCRIQRFCWKEKEK